jgi:S-(hydroxymethyl)glutathione dehydrogenase/alcohol dehydrogenase
MVGADMIIGVDINPRARPGASVRHDALRQPEGGRAATSSPHLVELTDGGADYSFECIGNTR